MYKEMFCLPFSSLFCFHRSSFAFTVSIAVLLLRYVENYVEEEISGVYMATHMNDEPPCVTVTY